MKIIISKDFGGGFYVRDRVFEEALWDIAEKELRRDYGDDWINNTSDLESVIERKINKMIDDIPEKEWRQNETLAAAIKNEHGKYRVYDYPDNATDYLVTNYDGAETLFFCIDGKIVEADEYIQSKEISEQSIQKKEKRQINFDFGR